MGLSLKQQANVFATKLSAKFGAWLPTPVPVLQLPSLAMQAITYRPAFPVKTYASVTDMCLSLATLTWTADEGLDKLTDSVKHPTYFEEAIQKHPKQAGDCTSFAAYACVALLKAGLADKVFFCSEIWEDAHHDNGMNGHAICVFQVADHWYWVSNWFSCHPQQILHQHDWVKAIEIRKGKPVVATQYEAKRLPDDTLMLGKMTQVF